MVSTRVRIGLLVILVLVVAAIDLGVFLISHRFDKYLTNERILVLEKLLGIFLAALAVQFIINGLANFSYKAYALLIKPNAAPQ